MSELLTFIELGFRHITDVLGLDHVLFLLALAAIYRPRDWRAVLWVISAFTVGHSITLALAVTQLVRLPTAWIEFLIPVTIVLTACSNVLGSVSPRPHVPTTPLRPLAAGAFGLIHGAGFANYLESMFVDRVAVPLVGFNIGIELGQVVVLLAAGTALVALDSGIKRFSPAPSTQHPAPRVRIFAVSLVIGLIAARWSIQRAPW